MQIQQKNEWMSEWHSLCHAILQLRTVIPSHCRGSCPYIPGSMLQKAKLCFEHSRIHSKHLEIRVHCAPITLAGVGPQQALCLGFASLFDSRYWILGQMLNWLKMLIWARYWIGLCCLSQLQSNQNDDVEFLSLPPLLFFFYLQKSWFSQSCKKNFGFMPS